jgi:hypothetical protein
MSLEAIIASLRLAPNSGRVKRDAGGAGRGNTPEPERRRRSAPPFMNSAGLSTDFGTKADPDTIVHF